MKRRRRTLLGAKRKKHSQLHRRSKFAMTVIMLLVVAVVGYQLVGLFARQEVSANELAKVQSSIQEEEERSKEIARREEYVGTDAFYEELARNKYGLAYENEIMFVAE